MQPSPKVVPPGSGKRMNILGDVVISVVAGADTGGVYAVQHQLTQPGDGPPLHQHSREDEGFFVLEGEYDFTVGEQIIRGVAGTFVFGPRGIAHTFKCVGLTVGRMQVIISPPGFEKFFDEVDSMVKEGWLQNLSKDMAKVVALARGYGVEIFGAPT
jgi:quercetin dioxygenase-like cupin family protein